MAEFTRADAAEWHVVAHNLFLHLLNPTRRPRQEVLRFVGCYESAKAITDLSRDRSLLRPQLTPAPM
jgi:hypothetical protein